MLDRGSSLVKQTAFVAVDEPGARFLRHARGIDSANSAEPFQRPDASSAATHFIDVWTRRAMLARLGRLRIAPTVIDIGCSSGHLLADLSARLPDATLIGVEHAPGDPHVAHGHLPDTVLLRADICSLPLEEACADVVLSANTLQHLDDDRRALEEIYRVLRPGGRAVLVVPVHPHGSDFHDRRHEYTRRYARGQMARKASRVGFELLQDVYLGSTLGRIACRMEELLLIGGVRLPFGIRGLTVLERPLASR